MLHKAFGKLRKLLPRVVAHAVKLYSALEFEEAPGLSPLHDPSDWLTNWFQLNAKCRFGYEVVEKIYSSGLTDEDRTQSLDTSLVRARSVVRTLLDLCQIYGYQGVDKIDLEFLLVDYCLLDQMAVLTDNLKYHLLWLANRGRKQAAPERKPIIHNLDGWLINWHFRCWCLRRLMREETFGETLLLGVKRGMPSLDESNVAREVNTLLDDLSLGSENKVTPEFLLEQCTRTAREIFGTIEPAPQARFQFSDKAGFEEEAAILKGGIRGVVFRWAVEKGYAFNEVQLSLIRWSPHLGMLPKYEHNLDMSYIRIWDGLLRHWIAEQELVRRPTKCRVAAVFEPLKVRPITAGEALRYALGKAFQQEMWSKLQNFDLFTLTGCSSDASIVQKALRVRLPDEIGQYQPRNDWIISADYKGATNSQHSDTTRTMLDAIFPDPCWRKIADDLVGSHEVHSFAKKDRSEGKGRRLLRKVLQTNGQLMGSMISFPLLCCVNAAVLRLAYEHVYKCKFSLKDLPALINGDDLLARADSLVYRTWSALVPLVGFQESPGKSYLSKLWGQVNSRTYNVVWNQTLDGPLVTNVRGFVNFGVLEGFQKGTNPQHEPDLEIVSCRLGSTQKEFDHLPEKIRQRAIALFRERLSSRYNAAFKAGFIPYIPSLSNPVEYGGLALFNAPLDLRKADEYRRWHYAKPSAIDYLSGELLPMQDRWERENGGKAADLDWWKAYFERQRLFRLVDKKPKVYWYKELCEEFLLERQLAEAEERQTQLNTVVGLMNDFYSSRQECASHYEADKSSDQNPYYVHPSLKGKLPSYEVQWMHEEELFFDGPE